VTVAETQAKQKKLYQQSRRALQPWPRITSMRPPSPHGPSGKRSKLLGGCLADPGRAAAIPKQAPPLHLAILAELRSRKNSDAGHTAAASRGASGAGNGPTVSPGEVTPTLLHAVGWKETSCASPDPYLIMSAFMPESLYYCSSPSGMFESPRCHSALGDARCTSASPEPYQSMSARSPKSPKSPYYTSPTAKRFKPPRCYSSLGSARSTGCASPDPYQSMSARTPESPYCRMPTGKPPRCHSSLSRARCDPPRCHSALGGARGDLLRD